MDMVVEIGYLTRILNAPRGVTSTAGANAYATKFATSPIITAREENKKVGKKLHYIKCYIQ